MNQQARTTRPSRRAIAPSLDPLEARQLLSAEPTLSHAETLRHHRAALFANARHMHHASTDMSASVAPLAATGHL
jgi:hypothetical protein